jgi:ABC-type polysaccharide/polyol phosphate transport system ATPase subunit
MDKIRELCERDCTVLIVSHGLEVVKTLAEHCIWLDRGELRMDSPASEAIDAYFAEEDVDETSAAALEDV